MKRTRLPSRLLTAAFVVLLLAAWWFFSPTQIGGSTRYVTTNGISMEPRFHTGDLAIVRPAEHYKVGDIVAYHSTLLNLTVLHRIIAIHGDQYVFKGDNNDFIDPTHPTRNELLGALWLHVPHGGIALRILHTPVVAAVACAALGLLLMFGAGERYRRRTRKRKRATAPGRVGPTIMKPQRKTDTAQPVNYGALLTASAVAVAVFLVLAVVAFTRPAHKPASSSTRYTQHVSFGYSARVPAGPVYPNGKIGTGDPIFLTMVHDLDVRIGYRFGSAANASIAGTEKILLNLAGPGGWSRSLVLTPSTHFVGGRTNTDVRLDLDQLQRLITRITRLTGNGQFSALSMTVQPVLHVSGTLGGHPVNASYQPGLSFQFQGSQLEPSASTQNGTPAASGAQAANYTPKQTGSLATPTTAPTTITVLGVSPEISLLRWIGVICLLLSIAATVYFYLRKRSEPFEETYRIQSQYGHMIVPIVGGEDLGWPPVDVPSIKALVMLAESGQRLILHNRSNGVDTYMLNEEGTVYRYQVKPSKVVWGEWSTPAADLGEAATEIARVAADAAPSASSAT